MSVATDHGSVGIVLLAMGGPQTIADIPEYLFNIFSDRNIIRLPGGSLIQKPFARMISRRRSSTVQEHYRRIGGGSPLLKWTQAQASLIASEMGPVRCYVGMRYFRPMTAQAIELAIADGCTDLTFLPMYPQYSRATTGSSFAEARKTLRRYPKVSATFIDEYHEDAGYIELLQSYITTHSRADDLLVFSAHSLPQKFVDEGDPYVEQIYRTASLAAGTREYVVTFQSRTGPVKWVGPDTVVGVKRLLQTSDRRLFIVPVAFVCDHIETLYELDIELPELAGGDASSRLRRMPMFNDDPQFAQVLAGIVRKRTTSNVKV